MISDVVKSIDSLSIPVVLFPNVIHYPNVLFIKSRNSDIQLTSTS